MSRVMEHLREGLGPKRGHRLAQGEKTQLTVQKNVLKYTTKQSEKNDNQSSTNV